MQETRLAAAAPKGKSKGASGAPVTRSPRYDLEALQRHVIRRCYLLPGQGGCRDVDGLGDRR